MEVGGGEGGGAGGAGQYDVTPPTEKEVRQGIYQNVLADRGRPTLVSTNCCVTGYQPTKPSVRRFKQKKNAREIFENSGMFVYIMALSRAAAGAVFPSYIRL